MNQQQPGAASKRYKYFSDLLNIFTAAAPSPGPGLVSAARRGGRGSEVIKFDHPTIKHLLFKLGGSTAAELGAAPPSTKLHGALAEAFQHKLGFCGLYVVMIFTLQHFRTQMLAIDKTLVRSADSGL